MCRGHPRILGFYTNELRLQSTYLLSYQFRWRAHQQYLPVYLHSYLILYSLQWILSLLSTSPAISLVLWLSDKLFFLQFVGQGSIGTGRLVHIYYIGNYVKDTQQSEYFSMKSRINSLVNKLTSNLTSNQWPDIVTCSWVGTRNSPLNLNI